MIPNSRKKEIRMNRLEATASWLFTCLGIALAAVSILVVPANAFADPGTVCGADCSAGDATFYGNCCATECADDPDCIAGCCGATCGADQDCYNACVAQAQTPGCAGDACDTPGKKCSLVKPPLCPSTSKWAIYCGSSSPKNRCDGCICDLVPPALVVCGCRLK